MRHSRKWVASPISVNLYLNCFFMSGFVFFVNMLCISYYWFII